MYDLRNPRDQDEPDPNKKTLVILGEHEFLSISELPANVDMLRYWLGICLLVEELGH